MTKDEKIALYEKIIKVTVTWNNNNIVWDNGYLELFKDVDLKITDAVVDGKPVTIVTTSFKP